MHTFSTLLIFIKFSGYSQACTVGIIGICIIPSRKMFEMMLELFRLSVHSDYKPEGSSITTTLNILHNVYNIKQI